MLCGLSILGETGLEATNIVSNHRDSCISLGGTGAHVLDVISMTCGVNDVEDLLVRLEFTESDINGDTTLTLSLQLVENPNVHERSLTGLGGLLIELFIGSLGICGCRFARVDVTVDNEIDLNLFHGHR